MATADKMMEGKLQIHFKIHKKVNFGKAVYVVGNIPELGLWKINFSLRLSWNQVTIYLLRNTIGVAILPSFIPFGPQLLNSNMLLETGKIHKLEL